MPRCEECFQPKTSPELTADKQTNKLICGYCKPVEVLQPVTPTFLGREVDYNLSYSKRGLDANIRVGGAKLNLTVDQAELTRLFGPETEK